MNESLIQYHFSPSLLVLSTAWYLHGKNVFRPFCTLNSFQFSYKAFFSVSLAFFVCEA